MDFLKKYLPANGVETVVVGMPRQMDGTPSDSYTYIRPFCHPGCKRSSPICGSRCSMNEFTSKLAFQAMIEGGVKKSRRRGDKGLVDRVSATIILQGYLESRH